MKTTEVTVEWEHGLHLLPAAHLVKIAGRFPCTLAITYRARRVIADSVLSLMLLSASAGAVLHIEADGDGENEVIHEIEKLFQSQLDDGNHGVPPASHSEVQ